MVDGIDMRLVQYREAHGHRAVAVVEDGRSSNQARRLEDAETVYELALEALELDKTMVETVRGHGTEAAVDLDEVARSGRLLPPLEHPVPTRCWITGTGLTHTGSADARDSMFKEASEGPISDGRKLFQLGLEGGKPPAGKLGVQPEWFFRGNGSTLIGSGQPLPLPEFAMDGGEEPEVVGLYVIADDGTPCRIGWALGNEFTDHRMEKLNHLYLGHSKLRTSAVGPELLLGPLPPSVEGTSRIRRGQTVVWERPFRSGEANMSHSIANLEAHHFKYPMFRRPGDVHLHFLGTSVVSAADGVTVQPGDVFEISAAPFGLPLQNPLHPTTWAQQTPVRVL